ncbi:MAG: bifunctional nuclease domain-containing protein [Candidatus Binataceae bacterium]|jgi:bifunctional DNase/RNase
MTASNPARNWIWPMLVAAIAMAALDACHHRSAGDEQVRVEVVDVGLDRDSGAPFVTLAEKRGKRQLPIWIGEAEARTIMLELHGITPQRPLTSDLLKSVIEKTGNRVDRVVIESIRDQTYYADIYLDGGRYRIDSRPSDAIALALGMKAPIFVAAKLFEPSPEAGPAKSANGPEAVRALGITVQELSREIAGYFNAEPGSGVLVADAQGEAARAGVERGDVLTRMAGKRIRNLGDFNDAMRTLKGSASVPLTLERDGRQRVVTLEVPAEWGG